MRIEERLGAVPNSAGATRARTMSWLFKFEDSIEPHDLNAMTQTGNLLHCQKEGKYYFNGGTDARPTQPPYQNASGDWFQQGNLDGFGVVVDL